MENQTTPAASGDQPNPAASSGAEGANATQPDMVRYDTHKKLLGEKKALQARLDAFERAQQENEEAALAKQGEFKDLYTQSKDQVKELTAKLQSAQDAQDNFKKLRAALGALDGKVDQKYYGHIGIEGILLDPDTGEVDEMSLNKCVEAFKRDHGVLIKNSTPTRLPNEAAQYASGVKSINQMSSSERANAAGLAMKNLPLSK